MLKAPQLYQAYVFQAAAAFRREGKEGGKPIAFLLHGVFQAIYNPTPLNTSRERGD
jgi:hypothetical protein